MESIDRTFTSSFTRSAADIGEGSRSESWLSKRAIREKTKEEPPYPHSDASTLTVLVSKAKHVVTYVLSSLGIELFLILPHAFAERQVGIRNKPRGM